MRLNGCIILCWEIAGMAQNKQKRLIYIMASQVRDSWSTVTILIVPRFFFQNLSKKTVFEKLSLSKSITGELK